MERRTWSKSKSCQIAYERIDQNVDFPSRQHIRQNLALWYQFIERASGSESIDKKERERCDIVKDEDGDAD